MRDKDRERGHRVNRERLRERSRERGGEERDTTLGFATGREEVALITVVVREEGWRTEGTASIRTIDLVIEEALDVVDGEEVLAVHRDNDSVPDLGHKNLYNCELRSRRR